MNGALIYTPPSPETCLQPRVRAIRDGIKPLDIPNDFQGPYGLHLVRDICIHYLDQSIRRSFSRMIDSDNYPDDPTYTQPKCYSVSRNPKAFRWFCLHASLLHNCIAIPVGEVDNNILWMCQLGHQATLCYEILISRIEVFNESFFVDLKLQSLKTMPVFWFSYIGQVTLKITSLLGSKCPKHT